MKRPLLSIIIPVKNGESTLKKCLNGIFEQTLAHQLEVIIIDSGSTDETLKLIVEYPVRIKQIPTIEFNHGATRNLGAELATGNLIFYTVQDAWMEDPHLLERMKEHFIDHEVVGVCGQQIVPHHSDKNPVQWFRPYSEPVPTRYQFKDEVGYSGLSPEERTLVAGWDNVIAMYRKEYLMQHPFDETNYSEDIRWARQALEDSKALVYDYGNRVCHYHHENYQYRYKRRFIENCQRYWTFQKLPKPNEALYQGIKKLMHHILKHSLSPKWWFYNTSLLISSYKADSECLKFASRKDVGGLLSRYQNISREVPQGAYHGKK